MAYNDDPFFKYTVEELKNMTHEEFCALLEESNEYVRKKWKEEKDQETPHFNSIEELRAYYNCIPFDEAVKRMNKLFEKYGFKL
ncbi:MAG: hypothetical protein II260_05720 [Muribaculaceae bacterium]|nr:hypothetical protein [Muribaculaceae bacterium]